MRPLKRIMPTELHDQHVLEEFGTIHQPSDAEPPILAPAVRGAVRQWMMELSAVAELERVRLKPRKTAILSGPPGCGKTTLAHHFAARLGLPMVVVNLAMVIDKWLGSSGRNITKLFNAVGKQPDDIVLFLDEFDAVGKKRTSGGQGADNERNAIVIALLQQMDTFTGTLIAATNLGEDIDPAIWRRFGLQLEILEPGEDERFAILKRYLEPMLVDDGLLDGLTEVTAGASPALLRGLMEGIKREMVLAPRFNQPIEKPVIFARILAAVRPHPDAKTIPPLWRDGFDLNLLADVPWPPTLPEKQP